MIYSLIKGEREDLLNKTLDKMREFDEAWIPFELRFSKLCIFAGSFAKVYLETMHLG